MIKADIAQITQQITFLDTRQLDELSLFIEFLISKQKKETKKNALQIIDLQGVMFL